MIMFVLHQDGSNFFNFDIEPKQFEKGEIIKHERLNGIYEVIHCDFASVTVRPFKRKEQIK
ncbi:hypothetical protein [Bacillus paralicheniformis]|uniref:hypothetical protein n=1 Tax=Bacillus paralicheniformis TaxID=1648923 RepID=UPI00117873ED|nr:hypothetical protein [Bacillus paralicheniformis]